MEKNNKNRENLHIKGIVITDTKSKKDLSDPDKESLDNWFAKIAHPDVDIPERIFDFEKFMKELDTPNENKK